MNRKYEELIKIIKDKQEDNKTEFNNLIKKEKINEEELLILFNELVDDHDDNTLNEEKKLLNNIIYKKEYKKEDITIGIVSIKKEIVDIFDFDEDLMLKEKYKIVYETKVMLIDDINCIDNLLSKRFENKKDSIRYAEELSSKFENMDLNDIVDVIINSI